MSRGCSRGGRLGMPSNVLLVMVVLPPQRFEMLTGCSDSPVSEAVLDSSCRLSREGFGVHVFGSPSCRRLLCTCLLSAIVLDTHWFLAWALRQCTLVGLQRFAEWCGHRSLSVCFTPSVCTGCGLGSSDFPVPWSSSLGVSACCGLSLGARLASGAWPMQLYIFS